MPLAETIDAFIKSDSGEILGLVLLLIGMTDLITAHIILKHYPEMLPLPAEQRRRFLPVLFFVSVFLTLIGFYILSFHWL